MTRYRRTFAQELRDAAPTAPSWLLLGVRRFQFPCGPCSLVVDPAGALVAFAGTTRENGRALASLPIPNVPSFVGAKFVEQWLVATPAACQQLGLALSNGLEVEIQ